MGIDKNRETQPVALDDNEPRNHDAPDNSSPDNSASNGAGSQEEKEIDLLELVYRLWDQRKTLLIWVMWGVLAGLIIAFSIPKEYSTSVKLAPESQSSRTPISGGLGALASMAGISAGGNTGSDAVYPTLYPDIVESVPFAISLFDVPVTNKEGKTFTVREYLEEETRGPWWGVIMSVPGKTIGFVMGIFRGKKDKEKDENHVTNSFKLTPEENGLVMELRKRISASIDQKTNVITIETTMQDPMVSAVLVDTVVDRLREYVTNYRTNKARQDLEYAQKLNDEAQQEYYKAQQRLADYIDRNQNLATRSAQVTQERLENESSLAFNLYNETALQVQSAKSRVQETTPVYTEITPATVPIRPTSPRKGLIIGGCAFLALVACAAWILFGTPLVEEYKKKAHELKAGRSDDNIEEDGESKGWKLWKRSKKGEKKDSDYQDS
ncbi:MAG: chain-length determining protein [Muribaculaceae bacterium]|nr:chain-length determining protein [Muribaculaceae bacterium]